MADLAVLASGNGSNFQAIIDALRGSAHRVVGLISDQPNAYALERAHRTEVPGRLISYADGKVAAERELRSVLAQLQPDLIALAGFMRILSPGLVDEFPHRIVNIHPSLLPRHRGLHAIERALEAGDRRIGITIHYVDAGVDTGPIIEQRSLERDPAWTVADAETAIHTLEHETYPRVLVRILDDLASVGKGAHG